MPNYNLSSRIRDVINAKATEAAAARRDHMSREFPLTVAEIQDAVCPADTLAALRHTASLTKDVIAKNDRFNALFDPSYLPGLQRRCGALLELPDYVYVPRGFSRWASVDQDMTERAVRDYARLDAGVLSDEAKEKVIKWANTAVREARLYALTVETVRFVLVQCVCVADLLARWPLLATLIEDNPNDPQMKVWKSRFRNPISARFLAKHKPHPDWVALNKNNMTAAELVINTGLLVGKWTRPTGVSVGNMTQWVRLPNDPPNT